MGELEIGFALEPGSSSVVLGMSFTNLGPKPVRLREVTVLDGRYGPGLEGEDLQVVMGTSGWRNSRIGRPPAEGENNLLCFRPDPTHKRSLVAGGLTYVDFRKFLKVGEGRIVMCARDPDPWEDGWIRG